MEEREVVTSFLRNGGRILILRRSSEVGTYQGRWAGVSGYLEKDDQPITRALKELEEEVGLGTKDIQLIRSGEPLRVLDKKNDVTWIVYPFLFESKTDVVTVDWEHREYKWVDPSELTSYETVPMLKETFDRVC
jgi:8-oxo-dGTP pyrophosphatase MutT (NUDIX family)